jgi:hypothetical protein
MQPNDSGGPHPSSQIIFHSIVGQLCVTSPLSVPTLLGEVRSTLKNLRQGVSPAQVAAQLFARVSTADGAAWKPEIGHVSWDVPGVRVSVHSESSYVLTRIGVETSAKLESIDLPPKKSAARIGWVAEAMMPSSETRVVLQSMLGSIVIDVDRRKSVIQGIVLGAVSEPSLRHKPSVLAGAILGGLWDLPGVLSSMKVDVGPVPGTPDTLWLRHLSGQTYAYCEGTDPDPAKWQIVGQGFLGPHVERHLRSSYGSGSAPVLAGSIRSSDGH